MSTRHDYKVTVLGAAGGIGQALSLILQMRLPLGTTLALHVPRPPLCTEINPTA